LGVRSNQFPGHPVQFVSGAGHSGFHQYFHDRGHADCDFLLYNSFVLGNPPMLVVKTNGYTTNALEIYSTLLPTSSSAPVGILPAPLLHW